MSLLAQSPVGAVEDRRRPGHVEQFEARIDDEDDMMHWQKIPYLCHFCHSVASVDFDQFNGGADRLTARPFLSTGDTQPCRNPCFSGAVSPLIILCLAGFAGWVFSLPATTAAAEAPPVPQEEADAMLASLQTRSKRAPAGRDHRHQRCHRDHRLSHADGHPAARRCGRRDDAGDRPGTGAALSGAQGRA